MTVGRLAIPAALLLLCSCSLFRGKEDAPQPRLAETPRNLHELSDPSATDTALNRQIQRAGFTLSIKADAGLNRFRGSAHALHLCLYQLKEPNGFRQLGEEREGLARLMECRPFDGSVIHAGRMVVQPGERIRVTRERAEGVRYLGFATGYYGSSKQKTIKLVPLPQNGAMSGGALSIELGPGAIEKITVD